jgi:hypothetical protein
VLALPGGAVADVRIGLTSTRRVSRIDVRERPLRGLDATGRRLVVAQP